MYLIKFTIKIFILATKTYIYCYGRFIVHIYFIAVSWEKEAFSRHKTIECEFFFLEEKGVTRFFSRLK